MNEMEVGSQSSHPRLRPGERREPLLISLAPAQHWLFVGECESALVSPDRAYSLLLERRLLLEDLECLDGAPVELVAALDDAADQTKAALALDGPSSRYLRSLARPIRRAAVAPTFLVPVPLRVYARAADLTPEAVIKAGAVAQAVAWERASVASGRTMAEWGLLAILKAFGFAPQTSCAPVGR
jgi:hypothetical protein